MKAAIEAYIADRQHAVGETVEFGWFIFRIAEAGRPPRLQSLDFRRMASFTDDFTAAEKIYALQRAALEVNGASERPCTLWQSALVSVSYIPGHPDAFIQRSESTNDRDSGWYVGILDDPADMNDGASFATRSLYELTIHDMRMAAFWLLPTGTTVKLKEPLPLPAGL